MTHASKRITAGDRVVFSLFGEEFTINEIHAIALGTVGFFVGEGGLAINTILDEPHYFIVAFLLSYLAGRRFHLGESPEN